MKFNGTIQRLHAVASRFVSLMFSPTYIVCSGVFRHHHMNFLTFPSCPYVRDCLSETITTPLLDYYPFLHYGPSTQVSSGPWEKTELDTYFFIFLPFSLKEYLSIIAHSSIFIAHIKVSTIIFFLFHTQKIYSENKDNVNLEVSKNCLETKYTTKYRQQKL
jgi:hypothetical protein